MSSLEILFCSVIGWVLGVLVGMWLTRRKSMTIVKAMIRPLDFTNYPNIPEYTQGALKQYVEDGLSPGAFLVAVLTNNLMGAIFTGDNNNLKALKEICMFVYNDIPGNAWGTKEKMTKWIAKINKETRG